MEKYLSRWTLEELKQFSSVHGPLIVAASADCLSMLHVFVLNAKVSSCSVFLAICTIFRILEAFIAPRL